MEWNLELFSLDELNLMLSDALKCDPESDKEFIKAVCTRIGQLQKIGKFQNS